MGRKNLYTIRKNLRYTQKALAEVAGISQRQYFNIENGISEGSVVVWQKLSTFLETPLEELLKEADQ